MGSPAFTTFCYSGHIVESVPEHCIPENDVTECPWCHSQLFHTIIEWHNREEECTLVDYEPVAFEWHQVTSDNLVGQVKIAVYNVNKIRVWHYKNKKIITRQRTHKKENK